LNLQLGDFLKQLNQHSLLRGVQVLDDDVGRARVDGDILEKRFDGCQAAGRGANANDVKRGGRGVRKVVRSEVLGR